MSELETIDESQVKLLHGIERFPLSPCLIMCESESSSSMVIPYRDPVCSSLCCHFSISQTMKTPSIKEKDVRGGRWKWC
jgi:hypothetical protein